jgi:hypothetical protein
MSTVTYPEEHVIREVTEQFVPLKLECNFQKPTELMKKYHVRWTPTLFVLEEDGKPRFHSVGFLPPEELVGRLELIRAMELFDRGELETASMRLREVADIFSTSAAAPQALYYENVANYMRTHDAKYLKQAHLKLRERYPESLWAKKSTPYADIPG